VVKGGVYLNNLNVFGSEALASQGSAEAKASLPNSRINVATYYISKSLVIAIN